MIQKAEHYVFDCPSCNKRLSSGKSLQGKISRCPKCRQNIRVPVYVEPRQKRPSIIRRYGNWCGKRSIVLQILTISWGMMMVCLAAAMIYISLHIADHPMYQYKIKEEKEMITAQHLVTSVTLPSALFVVIGVPMGIAAICTLRSKPQ